MASLRSVLFFGFLFLLYSAPSLASSTASSLVQTTCSQTSNYSFCLEALQSDPRSSKAGDVGSLSAIAVKLAIAGAKGAAAYASGMSKNATAEAPAAPLRTCADKFRNAGEALGAALQALQEENYDYASVHMEAAQDYASTCRRAFQRASPALVYPEAMAKKEDELHRLCTTASDIISQLA